VRAGLSDPRRCVTRACISPAVGQLVVVHMSTPSTALKPVLMGVVAGCLAIVTPWEPVLLLGILLVVLFVARPERVRGVPLRVYGISTAAASVVILAGAFAPVKQLDRRVEPMHYEEMPLEHLTRALARDWKVIVRPDHLAAADMVLTFITSEPLTRREVLQKLAAETGGELQIRYCGTGATILFGAHPSFTRLRIAQPNDAPNDGPATSVENSDGSGGGRHR
jgi:hypothetical protein